MILSFWLMSFELLRELLRCTELGGAKEATFSRFCEELLREDALRKLAATKLVFARGHPLVLTENGDYLHVRDRCCSPSPSGSPVGMFLVAMVSLSRWIVPCISSCRACVSSFSFIAWARSAS